MTRTRRGYALIELLVLLTVIAVILGLCAGMIHLLLKLDRAGRTSFEEAADMARLARDFRADVHASAASNPPARTPDGLKLDVAAGRSVEYLARAGDILRTVREGEKIRRRELYRRPARSEVRFESSPEGSSTIVSLIVRRGAGGKETSANRDVRIDAAVGLDQPSSERSK